LDDALAPLHSCLSSLINIWPIKLFALLRQLAFGGFVGNLSCSKERKDLVLSKKQWCQLMRILKASLKRRKMFAREAKFLLRLEHPQIARVLEHFQEDNRSYLVLEYIPGQDLRQLVKQNGKQSRAVVLEWFRQLSLILDYLHTQKPPIIHRDLTPDNIV